MQTMEELAKGVLAAYTTDTNVANLAACLHHGNGAMSVQGTERGLVVLRDISNIMDPEDPEFTPVILSFGTPAVPHSNQLGSASMVGKHWRKIGDSKGLQGQRPNALYKHWAPVATRTTALIPIGGPYGPERASTADIEDTENNYVWYDLSDVPVGGVIYRAAGDGNITAFQRLNDDRWIKLRNRGNCRRDFGETWQLTRGVDLAAIPRDTSVPRPVAFDPALLPTRTPRP